ncbi:MAG: hypothetical protein EBT03_12705 [Betaproteobacteria bacterium]|nr:hypothetical protein [Betaproteobacteria bacterium]NCA17106.1 hypothetical protein [Betaproteobacteria bacterium]
MSTKNDGKYAEGVLFDVSHVPPGYVDIAPLHRTEKALHNFTLRACRAGRVRRFRVKRSSDDSIGFMFVHSEDMDRLREELQCKQVKSQKANACEHDFEEYPSMCASLADVSASLGFLVALVERLVVAAESCATQPKTPHQELLHTINGNPAPWNET